MIRGTGVPMHGDRSLIQFPQSFWDQSFAAVRGTGCLQLPANLVYYSGADRPGRR